MDHSSVQLRDLFLHFLDTMQPSDPQAWIQVWNLIIAHPWYQQRLATITRGILVKENAPLAWAEDLQHDAMLLLARNLRDSPDLGIDRRRAGHQFDSWMNTIIAHHVRQSIRRMRRMTRETTLRLPKAHRDNSPDVDRRIDIQFAVELLDEPDRTVITLFSHGLRVVEISSALRLSYRRTHYALSRGLQRLQVFLARYQ